MTTPLLAEFPELAHLSREDLEDLLADPTFFQAIFHSLDRVKELYKSQAELGYANETIAQNNLTLQQQLYNLRSETKDAFDDAKRLEARWKELEKEQRDVYQRYTPQFLLMRLKHSITAQDDASEAVASTFVSSTDNPVANNSEIDEFVKEFKKLRKNISQTASLASLLSVTSAHTIFQELYVNGVDQGHLTGIRVPDYDGPITDVTSNDLICNGGINPYHTPISQAVIDIPAGAQVTAEWHHTLNGADPSDPADPIDSSHKGPVLAYLAKIPDATQTDVTGLQWFKIYHDGYDGGTWAVDKLISNKGKVTFGIPSCIASGQYLLRVELIALHAASSYPGAQFYMECAQINITGGSGSASPATVSFPGAYKAASAATPSLDPASLAVEQPEPEPEALDPGYDALECRDYQNL
ncbi:hypothetical protein NP233_g10004 [Leucocoprinus birnbaumii]|uniref:AA9 family lytic polysaccharide monooxygenase n=1 Tax=Leucocoprinus birnbaumii TaxID=56174 RepID=A0AAD5VQ09_9AGAR|nr:hypothetical protein NP233_g10004 [Leucocoprinus birnbaumii]